jgi:hypothetical protein
MLYMVIRKSPELHVGIASIGVSARRFEGSGLFHGPRELGRKKKRAGVASRPPDILLQRAGAYFAAASLVFTVA